GSTALAAATRPLSTLSLRVAPPQYRGAMRSLKSLQSCSRNSVSPGASTTNTTSISGAASSLSIACRSIGLPRSREYCFGPATPKRDPEPAAGMRPKYLEVTEIGGDSTRYNYSRLSEMNAVVLPESHNSEGGARLHGSSDALGFARLAQEQ